MMPARSRAREILMQALYQYAVQPDSKDEILKFSWVREDLYRKITEFAAEEFCGMLDRLSLIDRTIQEQSAKWSTDRIGRIEMAILRLGVYELLYIDEIPATATISECINLANRFGNDDSYKFINGVLDAVARRTGKTQKTAGDG